MRWKILSVIVVGLMIVAGCGKEGGNGDEPAVSSAKSQEAKVAEYNRFTEFAQAIVKNDMDRIKELANSEEYLSARGASGASPLVSAMSMNKPEVAKLLIGKGIELDSWSLGECTGIRDQEQRMEIVSLLIKKGAEVNASGSTGSTALHKAAAAGDLDLVRLLLENGADPMRQDDAGNTPLDFAQKYDNPQVAALLKKGSK